MTLIAAGGGRAMLVELSVMEQRYHAASLAEFVGHPAYGLPQLRADLERFVFLLGGSDGEPLFGP